MLVCLLECLCQSVRLVIDGLCLLLVLLSVGELVADGYTIASSYQLWQVGVKGMVGKGCIVILFTFGCLTL